MFEEMKHAALLTPLLELRDSELRETMRPPWKDLGCDPGSRHADCPVYEWGSFVAEVVCGRPLFAGNGAELSMQHLSHEPQLERIPKPVRSVVKRAINKRPELRYESVEDFVEAMLAVMPAEVTPTPPAMAVIVESKQSWVPVLMATIPAGVLFLIERTLWEPTVMSISLCRLGTAIVATLVVGLATMLLKRLVPESESDVAAHAVAGIAGGTVLSGIDAASGGYAWDCIAGPSSPAIAHLLLIFGLTLGVSRWFVGLLNASGEPVATIIVAGIFGWGAAMFFEATHPVSNGAANYTMLFPAWLSTLTVGSCILDWKTRGKRDVR